MFEPLLHKSSDSYEELLLGDFFNHVPTTITVDPCPEEINLRARFDVCSVSGGDLAEAFSNIKGAYNEENKIVQLIVFSLYVLGFLCLGHLSYENINYVFFELSSNL